MHLVVAWEGFAIYFSVYGILEDPYMMYSQTCSCWGGTIGLRWLRSKCFLFFSAAILQNFIKIAHSSSTYFAEYHSHFSSHEVGPWPVHFLVSCGWTGWQHGNMHVSCGSRMAPFLWVMSVFGDWIASNGCYTGPSVTNVHSYEWLCNFSRQWPLFCLTSCLFSWHYASCLSLPIFSPLFMPADAQSQHTWPSMNHPLLSWGDWWWQIWLCPFTCWSDVYMSECW